MINIRQKLILISVFTIFCLSLLRQHLYLFTFENKTHGTLVSLRNVQENNTNWSRRAAFLDDVPKTNRSTYLVNTPYCKIPNIHPFHPTIKKFINILEPAVCEWNATLVYQRGYYLYVNWTAVSLQPYNVTFCTYVPIYRPTFSPTHKNFLSYGNKSEPFTASIKVPHEFVRVNCYDKKNNSVYLNFYAFVQNNTDPYKLFKSRLELYMKGKDLKKSLNVMLVGIDSLSRLNFMRHLVKTRAFLRDKLAAFDMMGYNKVADNTLVNIVPLALGKFIGEISWSKNKTFDEFKFIWKQYAERGYRTLFAEDQPEISIFNHLKKGFNVPPCEHYFRPMNIAMDKEKVYWTNKHTCFQDRLETEIILNYTYDFVSFYRHNAYFSFTFLSRMTHGRQNGGSAVDHIYYNFFKRLHNNDLIQNTIIFLFSDHGMRYGSLRNTFIGKLEERLPLMYLILPQWLRNSYPDLLNNLHVNQNRLATPFDVYETLQDILFFDGLIRPVNSSSRGVSWFRKIPKTRSCKSAGVLSHWCTCLQHEKLKTNDTKVVNVSKQVLKEINKLVLQDEAICEELSVYQIKDALRIYESDQVVLGSRGTLDDINVKNALELERNRQVSTEYIQVTIETSPGQAIFEATVRVEFNNTRMYYRLVDDISRINLYGNQSACVDNFHLKKFCFCKRSPDSKKI